MKYLLTVDQEGHEKYEVNGKPSRKDLEDLGFVVPDGFIELRVSPKDDVLPKVRLVAGTSYNPQGSINLAKGVTDFVTLHNSAEIAFNQVVPKLVIRCSVV